MNNTKLYSILTSKRSFLLILPTSSKYFWFCFPKNSSQNQDWTSLIQPISNSSKMCLLSSLINSSSPTLYLLQILFSNSISSNSSHNSSNYFLCRNPSNSSKLFANINLYGILISYKQLTDLIIYCREFKKREEWCFAFRDMMLPNKISTSSTFTRCLLLSARISSSDCRSLRKRCKNNKRIKVDLLSTSICRLEKSNLKIWRATLLVVFTNGLLSKVENLDRICLLILSSKITS